jgi:hypothetical protein
MHHFLADLKLDFDVPDMLIAPTLEEVRHVVEEPVKSRKRANVTQRAMPGSIHHLSKPRKAWPN